MNDLRTPLAAVLLGTGIGLALLAAAGPAFAAVDVTRAAGAVYAGAWAQDAPPGAGPVTAILSDGWTPFAIMTLLLLGVLALFGLLYKHMTATNEREITRSESREVRHAAEISSLTDAIREDTEQKRALVANVATLTAEIVRLREDVAR